MLSGMEIHVVAQGKGPGQTIFRSLISRSDVQYILTFRVKTQKSRIELRKYFAVVRIIVRIQRYLVTGERPVNRASFFFTKNILKIPRRIEAYNCNECRRSEACGTLFVSSF